eukprot:g16045.t1
MDGVEESGAAKNRLHEHFADTAVVAPPTPQRMTELVANFPALQQAMAGSPRDENSLEGALLRVGSNLRTRRRRKAQQGVEQVAAERGNKVAWGCGLRTHDHEPRQTRLSLIQHLTPTVEPKEDAGIPSTSGPGVGHAPHTPAETTAFAPPPRHSPAASSMGYANTATARHHLHVDTQHWDWPSQHTYIQPPGVASSNMLPAAHSPSDPTGTTARVVQVSADTGTGAPTEHIQQQERKIADLQRQLQEMKMQIAQRKVPLQPPTGVQQSATGRVSGSSGVYAPTPMSARSLVTAGNRSHTTPGLGREEVKENRSHDEHSSYSREENHSASTSRRN